MRSMITERQQARWHNLINLKRTHLQQLNTEDGTGVPYTSVEDHFVVNLDEESVCAADGVLKVIGLADVKKHEKERQNFNDDDEGHCCWRRRGPLHGADGREDPEGWIQRGQAGERRRPVGIVHRDDPNRVHDRRGL